MRLQHLDYARSILEDRDVIVSFSGGKDSIVVLELAKQYGKRVEAFQMELLPGLEVLAAPVREAEARYPGLKVRRFPHWLRGYFGREGVYCFGKQAPVLNINDVYALMRHETGIDLVVTGAKKGDSLRLRGSGVHKYKNPALLAAPIWEWRQLDVLAYMASRKLPRPPNDGRASGGVDMTAESVLFLHDRYPADYAKLHDFFTFVGAIERRRHWHGIGPDYSPAGLAKEAAEKAARQPGVIRRRTSVEGRESGTAPPASG